MQSPGYSQRGEAERATELFPAEIRFDPQKYGVLLTDDTEVYLEDASGKRYEMNPSGDDFIFRGEVTGPEFHYRFLLRSPRGSRRIPENGTMEVINEAEGAETEEAGEVPYEEIQSRRQGVRDRVGTILPSEGFKRDKREERVEFRHEKGGKRENLASISKAIGKQLTPFLEVAKKEGGPESFGVLLERLELYLHNSVNFREALENMAEEERESLAVLVLTQLILSMKDIPVEIREQFDNEEDMPLTMAEFEEKMRDGARLFERKVFLRLKADPASRKALGLSPDSTNFSNKKILAEFERVCSLFTRVNSISALHFAVDEIKHVSGERSEEEIGEAYERAQERAEILRKVAARSREKKGFLESAHGSKRKMLLELGIQGGLGVGYLLGGGWTLASLLALKVGGEGILGIRLSDILSARKSENPELAFQELKTKAKKNNVISKWWNSEKSFWKVVKENFGSALKINIPFIGPKLEARKEARDLTREVGQHEEKDPAKIIQRACLHELNSSTSGARTQRRFS